MEANWRELPAGDELDRLIAERLGWTGISQPSYWLRGWVSFPPGAREQTKIPEYSTSADAGLSLLPSPPHILLISRGENGTWRVQVDTFLSRLKDIWDGEGDTLEMACCHAFLDHAERNEVTHG